MPDAGQHEVDVMVLRLELARGRGDVRGDHFLGRRLAGFVFRVNVDRGVAEGTGRHLLAVLIEDLEVLRRDVEHDPPHLLADGRGDAGQAAAPLGRPAGKGQGMVRQVRPVQESGFGGPLFQLPGVEGFAVDKVFHAWYLYRMGFEIVKVA